MKRKEWRNKLLQMILKGPQNWKKQHNIRRHTDQFSILPQGSSESDLNQSFLFVIFTDGDGNMKGFSWEDILAEIAKSISSNCNRVVILYKYEFQR